MTLSLCVTIRRNEFTYSNNVRVRIPREAAFEGLMGSGMHNLPVQLCRANKVFSGNPSFAFRFNTKFVDMIPPNSAKTIL